MKQLDDMIERLKKLDYEILEIVEQQVKANEHVILKMNSEDQLFAKGINTSSVRLADYRPYSPTTVAIKREKGQPTDRVTLRDTQDFHNSFFIEYTADGFYINASDWKTRSLVEKYGEYILGLTDKNVEEFAKTFVYPAVQQLIKNI